MPRMLGQLLGHMECCTPAGWVSGVDLRWSRRLAYTERLLGPLGLAAGRRLGQVVRRLLLGQAGWRSLVMLRVPPLAPSEMPKTPLAPSEMPNSLAPPSEATDSVAPPSEATDSLAPPSEAPDSLAPPSEATGSLAPPSEVTGSRRFAGGTQP